MAEPVYGPICHEHGIRGYGDPSHGVVIVGIAPGAHEITKTKRPFTGVSGTLLDKCLSFVGWPREKTYTTNTICWQNNSPSEEEIELCGDRFRLELTRVKPKLIVTAGAIANETVMGSKRKKGSRGSVVWSKRWKCYVLDTHHPSFALQAKSMSAVQDIIRDFSKIEMVLGWPTDGSVADISYKTVETLAEGQWVLDNLPRDNKTVVTLDIETSSPDVELMDAWTDTLLCFAISWDDPHTNQEQCYVFPERLFPQCVRDGTHQRGLRSRGACPTPDCAYGHSSGLSWPTEGVRWTFQGGQYDVPGLYEKLGVLLPLRDDTMLMSHCTDERPGYHGLKPNAREWLGAGWYDEPVKPFYKGKMHLLPAASVEEYNAKDAIYDKRLVPVFWRKMQEDDTVRLYQNILLPAMQSFIPMQIRGINIDRRRLQQLAYDNWFPKYIQMYEDLQKEAREIGWPTDDININSNPQLAKLFYQIIGLDVTKLTKTGRPSTDKETLDRMDHPFAAKIREYRTLDGICDDVFELFDCMKADGLIHPFAYITNTRTGRTAYQRPGAQQWPKDYTVGADYARIRETIIPHNPDTHVIVEADYNQVEVWLAQHESGDQTLLAHLQSGDVHSATAEGAFSTSRTLHTKEEWSVLRQNAKKIRFGLQYGEGASGLARPRPVGIGGTPAEAQKFIDNFWRTYPRHAAWMKEIQNLARTQGYLRTPTGRVMRFPAIMDHRELRQAINFPVQVNASDYNLTSMIELAHPDHSRYPASKRLAELKSWVLLNIHDCLVVEAHRDHVAEVMALMRDVMQKPRIPGYPSIRVDFKVGDSLGTVKEYH